MKKRILSILVICCMVLGLLPTTAFADNDSVKKAIQIGTSGISGYDSTNSSYDYIHFGTWNNSTVKWRVLDTKTNMANAQRGDGFFLLSEVLLGTGEYGGVEFDYTTPYFNDWKGSRGQDWCNDFYSRSLSITEQKAVLATSKSDALYGMYYDASDNILDGDKVFFLSAEEAENAAYGFTDDNARIANYGDSAYVWWLRSPRRMNPDSAGTVNEKGAVIGEWVGQTNAARPAFNLKPDSVLLVSAAVGGKGTADGMFKIPEYSGDEWKLTLLDDTRTFRVTETTAAGKPGGTVTLNFSGPRTGLNEYISAIIEGESGATYYGRIMKPTAADRQLSFTLPHDLASGNYKLHVFSEQYNGDYQTDYASRFQTVALTVEEAATEQFALTPGGTYYFDLSGENIPGTINDDLPDKSMHYVPFTYAGAVNAYKLTSAMATTEEYAQQYKYDHSLFIADHAVTHTVSWDDLNTKSLIFGKDYVAGGVDYTLRAPSVGSGRTYSGESQRGTPLSNEWDKILDKDSGYIKNWSERSSWGQDTKPDNSFPIRANRGDHTARHWSYDHASDSSPHVSFRPVLEVLNSDTLDSDGMKVVTLDLGGGTLGGSSDAIYIIVKTGSEFTAPASGGLTRPDGNTGSYFMWLGSNGTSYAPGASVPTDVTTLTVQWTAPTYTVTLNAGDGTINSGNVTSYTYGVGATLPTNVTRTGYTFKGWYDSENLTGSPVTAISNAETGNKEYWAKWEINQYTITFDTVGGSTVASITQDYGTAIAAPADPTREGYTFIGWDKEIPSTMPAENVTVTAKWVVNQYTITFDTAGGSAVASITQDYGTAITAPANPTREGYTFIGWDKAIPATMPAENMIITANWKVNQYTITFDSNGGSEIAPITQDYGTAITAPANPTREGYTFIGWDKAIPATMPAEDLTITAQWRDIAVPTGEIKIAENGWKSFLNTITFRLFFKDTQTVTVTAADNSGEAVKIEYLLSDKALTESELAGKTFTAYSAPFSINPDNEYVIYAKLTDTSGNFAYINTNGIVLDATVPGISGIADGKTYCAAQTITVDEKYIGTVKVNGTEVSLDKNSQFALSPASGKQTIVVTDKAGNETRVTVTVNDGHTYEWQSENGQYWQKCKFCNHETAKKDIPTINISGADKVCRTQDYKFSFTLPEGATGAAYGYKFIGFSDDPLTPIVENGLYSGIIKASAYPATENSFKLIVSAKTADGFAFSAEKKVTIQNEHSGGTATCKDKAICEVCGESYGKLDPNNHANLKHIDAKAATKTSEGNIEYWYCDGCNKYYKDAKATQEITKAQTVTAKLPPKITAGDGATVTQGEKKELSFTSDASFSDFLRVELDGTTLDEKNYTKKEGSTIITLNRDFVATLSVGEHTLAIVSQSGTATAKFTVKAKPAETATPQPTVTPQPTAQPQPTVQPVSPLPRTGDTANPALWFALLIVSGSALAAIFVLRRKDNRK